MLVFYFLILGVLFLGLGLGGSVLNGDRDFDRGFVAFATAPTLMAAVITSVATGSTFPIFVTAVVAVIGVVAGAWGHYGNQPYTPPSWNDIKDLDKDPLEEFRVALAKAAASRAKAEARILELEAEVERATVWIRRRDRQIDQLIDQVESLEEQLKPAEMLDANQQIARELSCFEPQDPRCRAPSAHACA